MTTCGIYYRVSTDLQRLNKTIESQKYELPLYAEKQGWEIVQEYTDDGISGGKYKGRKAYQQCLMDMEKKKFNVLLCIDIDRVTRFKRRAWRGEFFDSLEDNKILIASPSDGIRDVSNFGDDLVVDVKAKVATEESKKIAERLKRGRKNHCREGNYTQPHVPYGLKRLTDYEAKPKKHTMVLHEESAKVVQLIFDCVINKKLSLYMTADYLNNLGIKPPRGKNGQKWNAGNLPSLIRNNENSWTGEIVTNRWEFKDNDKSEKCELIGQRPESEWIRVPVPAILSKEEYEAIKEQVLQNRVNSNLQKLPEVFLLRGMIKCGLCGKPYLARQVAPKGKPINRYYICSGRVVDTKFLRDDQRRCMAPYVKSEILDMYVEGDLMKNLFMFPEKTLQNWTKDEAKDGVAKNAENKLKAKNEELDKVKQKLSNLMDASIGGLFPADMVNEKKAELDKALKIHTDEMVTLQKEVNRISMIERNKKAMAGVTLDLSKLGNKLSSKVAKLNIKEKRKLLAFFVKDGHIEISPCHPDDIHEERDSNGRKITIDWDFSFKGIIDLSILLKVLKEFDKTGDIPDPLSFYLRDKNNECFMW